MGIKRGDREGLREREMGKERGKNSLVYLKTYGSLLKDIWLSNKSLSWICSKKLKKKVNGY